jgi:hypothetical protein
MVIFTCLTVDVHLSSATEGTGAEVVEYKLLATTKTSTMQKELNEAAAEGYCFEGVMGGGTSFGGSEVVVILSRGKGSKPRYEYLLLATTKTSTMQREIQEAGDAGYIYRGQTVFSTAFSGNEAVVILERDREAADVPTHEYLLLATSKTSTMQKELTEAGEQGFEFVGMTVAETSFGGSEVVCILSRASQPEEASGEDDL